jgi:hypothetical protein
MEEAEGRKIIKEGREGRLLLVLEPQHHVNAKGNLAACQILSSVLVVGI